MPSRATGSQRQRDRAERLARTRAGSMDQPRAAPQQFQKLGRRQGAREQVALHLVAVVAAQQIELLARLHPLGDHLELQALGERDDRLRDRGVVGVGRDVLDERLVDLEGADREALEVAERGVAGPEVVDREPDAEAIERVQLGDRLLGAAHDAALGQLEVEVGRIEGRGLDHLGDAAHEVVLLELPAGQVDREAQVGEALFLPGPDLGAGGAQHPVPETRGSGRSPRRAG